MLAQVLDTLKTHIDTVYLQTDYSKLLERLVQNKSNCSPETFNIIVNIIIAVSALIAIYVSVKALKQSKEFKESENLTRRAWILPNDNPGYYDVNIDKEYVRYIELKNFGVNPANNIHMRVLSIIENPEDHKILEIDQTHTFEICNPVANNGLIANIVSYPNDDINSKLTERLYSITPKFLYLSIEYTDVILVSRFKVSFFWIVNKSNGNLFEVTIEQKEEIVNLINEFDNRMEKLSTEDNNKVK